VNGGGNLRANTGAQRVSFLFLTRGARRAAWVLALAACTHASGQVSVLDASFKIGSGASEAVDALVVQTNQRILVGGDFTSIGGRANAYLARLNPDGTVDTSFNPAGQTDGSVTCLLQQPDGKVVVGGGFGRIVGQSRPALARLLQTGAVDATFDASGTCTTNTSVFALALQNDGRFLVSYQDSADGKSRITRLETNGAPDSAFVCTNRFDGSITTMLPLPDGSVLFGGSISGVDGQTRYTLFRLQANGKLDTSFDAGLEMSSALCLVRQPDGQILVGGLLNRTGSTSSVPLLRLKSDLHWDETFQPDAFGGTHGVGNPTISALLLQPDGKIIAGGFFFEVGGYWRRQIVRLTAAGRVDGCFDPGLGLGAYTQGGPVRAIAGQADGRILIGGWFLGVDTAYRQQHIARLLAQSDCDLIRVYLQNGDQGFVAATFPPGRTNYLEESGDLATWQTVATNTSPYIYSWSLSTADPPRAFFRARQER
jgi:uncharacterized delta-60 repeat protein